VKSIQPGKPVCSITHTSEVDGTALSCVMIDGKISSKTMLLGVHAFLMALEESGNANAGKVAAELSRMSEYFISKTEPKGATGVNRGSLMGSKEHPAFGPYVLCDSRGGIRMNILSALKRAK
jgi:hypothetical protein